MPLARQEANGHCDGAIDFGAAGWCTTHETTAGLAITQRHAGLRFLNAVQLTVFPDRLLGGLSSSTGCRGRPLGLAIAVQQAGDCHRPAGPRYPARGARGASPCLGHGLAQNERGNPTQSEPRLVYGMLKAIPRGRRSAISLIGRQRQSSVLQQEAFGGGLAEGLKTGNIHTGAGRINPPAKRQRERQGQHACLFPARMYNKPVPAGNETPFRPLWPWARLDAAGPA